MCEGIRQTIVEKCAADLIVQKNQISACKVGEGCRGRGAHQEEYYLNRLSRITDGLTVGE